MSSMEVDESNEGFQSTLDENEDQRGSMRSDSSPFNSTMSPTRRKDHKKTRRHERGERSGYNGDRSHDNDQSPHSSDDENDRARNIGRRVYVGNLAWGVTWQDLKDYMRSAGQVEHAYILEVDRRSKGCGIVTFASESEAQNAIDTLNDTEFEGRKIFVREDREQQPVSSRMRGCRIYVGNLSYNVKWQDLKDHMKQAGVVVHADVLEEPGGRSKGCGLVEYSTPEEAQEAINMLNDTELEGRKIFVREDREPDGGSISSIVKRSGGRNSNRYSGRHGGQRSGGRGSYRDGGSGNFSSDVRQVYVGNLPWDTNWQSLKDLFRNAGTVERAEIAEFPDGRSRGFGIVRFATHADAQNAIEQLSGSDYNGRQLEVRLDKRG